MSGSDLVVGIDLGTTNSLVGAVVDGAPRLFADASGNELLPSAVAALPSGELLVGRAAKNRRLLDPEGTVVSVKRSMGTAARFRVGPRELSAAQVSALILGALLDRVANACAARPTRAVITVPAFFDDAQRQATRDAGALGGVTVERLVNEPTAAALTYRTGAEELVMVYDLGGGTFDVSVLERDEGLLEVRTSRGDTHLGGDDIDRALVRLVLERLGPSATAAVDGDARAMTRLVEAVERAKIALSDRDEVRLVEPFLAGDGAAAVHLDLPLTRADVGDVARPFVERTLACIDAALRDVGAKPRDLDRVLLVGGSSKMPIVRSLTAAHLGRPVQLDLDADRAVAIGATLLAGRISGAPIAEVLVDITPHTLAAGVADRPDDDHELVASPVIPRGSIVPIERSRTFGTSFANQKKVCVPIAQGERPLLDDNTELGQVVVDGLPPSPAGSPVEVTFRLDLSGVLHVSALHVPSGKGGSVTIADTPYRLTEQQRRAARAEVEALREASESAAGQAPASRASESDLALAKAVLVRAARAIDGKAEAAPIARVREASRALGDAVEKRSAATADLVDALTDALLDLI